MDLGRMPRWHLVDELRYRLKATRIAVVDGLCPGDAVLSRQDQKLSPLDSANAGEPRVNSRVS